MAPHKISWWSQNIWLYKKPTCKYHSIPVSRVGWLSNRNIQGVELEDKNNMTAVKQPTKPSPLLFLQPPYGTTCVWGADEQVLIDFACSYPFLGKLVERLGMLCGLFWHAPNESCEGQGIRRHGLYTPSHTLTKAAGTACAIHKNEGTIV